MKKLILFASILATAAFAADYIVGAETQSGNGTNGMTRAAPTLSTEGVPVVTSNISITPKPVATKAKVTLRASSTNTFQNAGDISYMRAYRYAMDPRDSTGATYVWQKAGNLDFAVDGGSGGASGPLTQNVLTFGPFDLGGVDRSGDRYLWACENCQQSGTLDAGVSVSIEMITP